jgi:hypothetical protein
VQHKNSPYVRVCSYVVVSSGWSTLTPAIGAGGEDCQLASTPTWLGGSTRQWRNRMILTIANCAWNRFSDGIIIPSYINERITVNWQIYQSDLSKTNLLCTLHFIPKLFQPLCSPSLLQMRFASILDDYAPPWWQSTGLPRKCSHAFRVKNEYQKYIADFSIGFIMLTSLYSGNEVLADMWPKSASTTNPVKSLMCSCFFDLSLVAYLHGIIRSMQSFKVSWRIGFLVAQLLVAYFQTIFRLGYLPESMHNFLRPNTNAQSLCPRLSVARRRISRLGCSSSTSPHGYI